MKEQELGQERLLKNLPSAAKKLTQQNSMQQLTQLYPWEDEITLLKCESDFPFLDKRIDFIMWARLPPAQATWQSTQQPNLKGSIVTCVSRLYQERGFQVMTEGCSFVICQALHTTGWLVRFLALLLRTSSLGKHGAGSCFGAVPYPVYPNQAHLGQFQKTEQSQFAIGPGKSLQCVYWLLSICQRVGCWV